MLFQKRLHFHQFFGKTRVTGSLSRQWYSKLPSKLADIKKLRSETNASMDLVKQSVEEAGVGNLELAREILKKKIVQRGGKLAEKSKNRTAKEGWIIQCISEDGRKAVMAEINCESDFVAQTTPFQDLAKRIASTFLHYLPTNHSSYSVEATLKNEILKHQAYVSKNHEANEKDVSSNVSLEEEIVKMTSFTGEKVQVQRLHCMNARVPSTAIGIFSHGAKQSSPLQQLGRIGSMVQINSDLSTRKGLSNQIAKEIVAQDPSSTSELLSFRSLVDSEKTIKDVLGQSTILEWVRWERGGN